ncbi:MAG: hypothetical protein L0Z50_20420 [Verrucomicrobiales bacterium]|nr:hypothetical protein [Verrucomicrobiales bacterium]
MLIDTSSPDITHRCHDRQFLLKFAKDRNAYRRRLLHAAREGDVAILKAVTSNHGHLVTLWHACNR